MEDGITGRLEPTVGASSLRAWERHLGREVDPLRLRAELAAGSLPEAFSRVAASHPDRPALLIDGEAVTHGELDARAGEAAAWLRSSGVESGDRVLLSGHSSISLGVAYLAILRAGATVVPAGATSSEAELRYLAEDSGASLALASGAVLTRLVSVARDLPRIRGLVPLNDLGNTHPSLDHSDVSGDDVAILAYTSGTTGQPKAAPLTHANLLSSIRAAMLAWRWDEDDVLVHALPLSHQHGLGGVHATLLAGSRAVIFSHFEPDALRRAIAAHRATVLFAVPTMYERLVQEGGGREDFISLRLAISGSAPLSPGLAERATEILGQMPLERYGTTESGLDVSNLYQGSRKPGALGLPLPGVEMEIVDDGGYPLPSSEDGEIVLRGPQIFAGYRNRPETDAATFLPGGWFRTGDVGRIDPEDGFLSITGRIKELIVTGGLNVYPREVELALEEHPAVGRAAVVGVPSERWGEEVTAFVVSAPDGKVDIDELGAFLRDRLSPYKRPKRFLVVRSLPANAMGKLDRAAMVQLAREDSEE